MTGNIQYVSDGFPMIVPMTYKETDLLNLTFGELILDDSLPSLTFGKLLLDDSLP